MGSCWNQQAETLVLRLGLRALHEHMLEPDTAARSRLQACAAQMGKTPHSQLCTAGLHHCRQWMYSHKVHQQVGVVHKVHLQQGSRSSWACVVDARRRIAA